MIGTWQDQYRRMHRSYTKVIGEHRSTDAYSDDLYHFFMDCWHLKDWLRHDLSVPEKLRGSVEKLVAGINALMIAADLANGVKHFQLINRKRGGAEIVATDVTFVVGPNIVTMNHRGKNDAGDEFVAEDVARQAVEAWDEILTAYDLSDPAR